MCGCESRQACTAALASHVMTPVISCCACMSCPHIVHACRALILCMHDVITLTHDPVIANLLPSPTVFIDFWASEASSLLGLLKFGGIFDHAE